MTPVLYSSLLQAANSQVPAYFVNRALCYLRLSNWTHVIDDCKQAVQLDPASIKAHFFMGQALAEIGNYDEALVELHKGTQAYTPYMGTHHIRVHRRGTSADMQFGG